MMIVPTPGMYRVTDGDVPKGGRFLGHQGGNVICSDYGKNSSSMFYGRSTLMVVFLPLGLSVDTVGMHIPHLREQRQ